MKILKRFPYTFAGLFAPPFIFFMMWVVTDQYNYTGAGPIWFYILFAPTIAINMYLGPNPIVFLISAFAQFLLIGLFIDIFRTRFVISRRPR